ncbi:hypothetical protein C482_04756 [Natrialba chahannaoensis JCM 10990]|uniref:Uncharacterized protein n=1 Tax=Natrialba chahannaoensis JCM 10990 TaxID=1227492 RepID=M0AY87_9EURY|nr:hypothetical protein [Natrialba chahannaoensis]ELZ02938.1 hypothetical protein C482_04756 [Natrialba chahannaoensis JCM 10990]
MDGTHISLVGINLSIVAGFWMMRNTLTEGTPIVTELHHLLLWGGLAITLVGLIVSIVRESNG